MAASKKVRMGEHSRSRGPRRAAQGRAAARVRPGDGRQAGCPAGHPASSQSVTNQAFMYIDAFYVDPKRVVPITLLESAFRSIESQYPEVLVDLAADKKAVTVRARGFDRTFDLSIMEGTADIARAIDQVVDFVAERLGAEVEKDKLLYLAVNGALRELDPHTNIFSMKHFKDFKISTSGSFGGIGFTFNAMDGELTIISPIPDTPAARAGLQSGDRIVFIDGVPTTNMSSDTAVGRMRGEPGTPVTLTVAREGWSEPHDFPIIREIIKIISVESRLLTGDDGPPVVYARVKNFQTDTSAELAAAIRKLETPAAAGVILDMRDNPGGLLDEAVKLADGFLDEGAIVSTRNRSGRGKVDSASRSDQPFTRLPLVVLVNRGSASASEIVSAALQDRRALLIGERTFGKGSVQQAFPLSDGGGVLLTVAQYLTPGDVSIQSIGVEPDIALDPVLVGAERLQLAAVKGHMGEADLENAFSTWGNARREAVASQRFLRTEDREHDADGDEEARGAARAHRAGEGRQARRRVRGAPRAPHPRRRRGRADAASRAGLLAVAQGVMAKTAPEEEQKIGTALAARSIDWSTGNASAGARRGSSPASRRGRSSGPARRPASPSRSPTPARDPAPGLGPHGFRQPAAEKHRLRLRHDRPRADARVDGAARGPRRGRGALGHPVAQPPGERGQRRHGHGRERRDAGPTGAGVRLPLHDHRREPAGQGQERRRAPRGGGAGAAHGRGDQPRRGPRARCSRST